MPKAFIRHGQPGITSVLPHQGNAVYAVPKVSGGPTPIVAPYLLFDDTRILTDNPPFLATLTGVWEFAAKVRPDLLSGGFNQQLLIGALTTNFELRIDWSSTVANLNLRVDGVNNDMQAPLVEGVEYEVRFGSDAAGMIYSEAIALDGSQPDHRAELSVTILSDITDRFQIGARFDNSVSFTGIINDVRTTLAGVTTHRYRINEGSGGVGTTIFDTGSNPVNAEITSIGTGGWVT